MNALSLILENPALRLGRREVLVRVAHASEVLRYSRREALVRLGSPVTRVFVIARGKIQLQGRNRPMGTRVLVSTLESPAIFGDAEAMSSRTWSTSARATEPSLVVAIERTAFEEMVACDTAIARALYRDACARATLLNHVVQIVALQATDQKILRLIWDCSERAKRKASGHATRISVNGLARALALSPKTISRALRALEANGVIRRKGSEVEFVDPEGLPRWPDLGTHGLGACWEI